MNFPPSSQFPIPHSSQVQFSSGIPPMTQPSVGWHQQSKLSLPPLDAFSARSERERRVPGDRNGYAPSSGSGKTTRKVVEKGKGVQSTPTRPLSRNNTLLRDIHSPPTARSRSRNSDPSTSAATTTVTVNSHVNTTSVNGNNGLSSSSKQTSRSRRLSATSESISHPGCGFGFDLSELIPPTFGRPVRGDNSRSRNCTSASGCSTDGGGGIGGGSGRGGGEYHQFNMTFPSLIKSVAQKLNTPDGAFSAFPPPRSTSTSRSPSRSHSGSDSRRSQPRRQGDTRFEVEHGGFVVDVGNGGVGSGSSGLVMNASGTRRRQLQRVPSLHAMDVDDNDGDGGEGKDGGDMEEEEDSDGGSNQFPPPRHLPLSLAHTRRSISNSTTSSSSCPTSSSPGSSTSPNTSVSKTSRFTRSASSPNTSFSGSTSMDVDDESESEDVDMNMSVTNTDMSTFFDSPYSSSAPPPPPPIIHGPHRVNRHDIVRSHSDQGKGRGGKVKVKAKTEMLPPPSPPHPTMSMTTTTTTTIAGKSPVSSSQLSQPFRPPFASTPHPPPHPHLHQRQHQQSITSSTSSSSTSHHPRHPTSSSSSLSSSTPPLPSLSIPPPPPTSTTTTTTTTIIQTSRPPPPRLGMRGPPSLSQTSRSHSLPEKQRGFKVPLLPKKVLREGSGASLGGRKGGTSPPGISSKVQDNNNNKEEKRTRRTNEVITSRDAAKVKENEKGLKIVDDGGASGEAEDEGDTLGDSSFGDISLEWNDECENVMRAAGV